MRIVRVVVATVLALAVVAVVATAQTAVPTVAVSASRSAIALTPSGSIAPGPTRFRVTKSGRGDVEFVLVTLRAGVTVDQLRRTLPRNDEAALSLVFIEASATTSNATPSRQFIVTLRPNVTYVALAIAGRRNQLTTFTTTGTASGARAGTPDATVRMVDYGFRGPSTLPRNGVIRVANRGTAFHFALAFPLRPGAGRAAVGRALRTENQKALGKLAGGAPFEVQDVLSPGSANDQAIRFAKRGRYAFVCFFGGHNRLGMYRIFRVR